METLEQMAGGPEEQDVPTAMEELVLPAVGNGAGTDAGGGIPSVTAYGGDSSPFAKGEPMDGTGSETAVGDGLDRSSAEDGAASDGTDAGGGIPSVTAYGGDSSPFAKGEPLDGDGSETAVGNLSCRSSAEDEAASDGTDVGGGIPSVTAYGGDSSPLAKGEPMDGDGSETEEGTDEGSGIPSVTAYGGDSSPLAKGEPLDGAGSETEEGTGEPVPYGEDDSDEGPELAEMIAWAKQPRRVRPEWVMVGIAFLAAVVLGVTAALCRPYFRDSEDPMGLPSRHMAASEPSTAPSEPAETEPKKPTIPPDPNPYDRYDFQYDGNNYLLLQNVESYPGVDVSAFQGEVDWQRVADSGIRFAIVRLGYRGYGSGKLVEDEYARINLEGAAEAGLMVGAYFFSQALNEKEVDEEIDFMLGILGEMYLDMPIILDWEIPAADARTAGKMDERSLTDLQLHFCREMAGRGYQPMVYFNWHQSEELYLLSELEEYPFWLALYQDRMTYPWKVEMWQYSCTGRVPGIAGDVDLNVYMP